MSDWGEWDLGGGLLGDVPFDAGSGEAAWNLDAGGDSSWWGDVTKALGGASGLTRLLGGAIGAGGNIIGANQASAGADRAAAITAAANAAALDKVLAANKEARDVMIQRSDRGLADIEAGLGQYRNTVAPLLTPTPVVIPQYRGLTPQQQIGLEDLRRGGLASISAAGLRGAGRAGIGALMDSERRFRAGVAAENDADTRQEMRRAQTSANAARQGLASAELQTGGAKGNTQIGVGNSLASSLQSGGQTAGNLTAQTGQAAANAANTTGLYNAGAATNTANLVGDTLGQLGAIVANQRSNIAAPGTWGV